MNDLPPNGSLATRLAALQQRIGMIDTRLGSKTGGPILIGASKSQPSEMLEEAIRMGLSQFGENKVQEAQAKWPDLKAGHPQVRLHLIGPLQSNKAREAVALFDVIQTLDREKIADALAAAMEKEGMMGARVASHGEPQSERGRSGGATPPAPKAPPKFLIQVNTGEESQKSGIFPRQAEALLHHCHKLELPVIGLMCVPPAGENPAPHFALLKKMANEFGLRELSMGMSGDFETAIRLGATMVRVGTALFGERH
jgi:uncharacterized pyridoxal phosphate-containing UPF0001 family protein